jgi:hexosaminidase
MTGLSLGQWLVFGVLMPAFATAGAIPDLMPWPMTITPGPGRLPLDSQLLVVLSGPEDQLARTGAERFVDRLHRATGVATVVVRQNPANFIGVRFSVEWQTNSPAVQGAIEDESYSLEVTSKEARLLAATPLGVLRGFETLLQCVESDPQGHSIPALVIRDQPRFAWRGLMLDCARHFMPVAELKRTLEGMAALKLNVFHWHLTDDQGFRFESKVFPKLTQAGSGGLYYTREDVREIVDLAHKLGIRVVPEFDMPGHTTSWFVGYPELASAPGPYSVKTRAALFEPTMDPTRPELYGFLDALFGEVAALFPDDYVHIGGDEVDLTQWRRSETIQKFIRNHALRDEHGLQTYFNKRVQVLLAKHHKKMIGWDEILASDLPAEVAVQVWRGTGSLADAVRTGHRGIYSFGYYLDQLRPASDHYLIDPLDGEGGALGPDERQRILGGEACLWTEYVSWENLNWRLWPRTAAIAERLWSSAETRDLDSMYRRLQGASNRLEALGLAPHAQRRAVLERLEADSSIGPLEVLLESIAPVHPDNRVHDQDHTLQVPLNRLVDMAEPESDAGRHLAQWVSAWKSHQDEICNLLKGWRGNSMIARRALEHSPSLKEAVGICDEVFALSSAGLEAMNYLERGRKPPRSWLTKQRELIERSALPRADLVVTLVEPVSALVAEAMNPRR